MTINRKHAVAVLAISIAAYLTYVNISMAQIVQTPVDEIHSAQSAPTAPKQQVFRFGIYDYTRTPKALTTHSSAVIAIPVSPERTYSDADAVMVAQVAWTEARGCSRLEQAAVIWCIVNRVDSPLPYLPDSIAEVVTQPYQFAYSPDSPVLPELLELAYDVLDRWECEKAGQSNVGRILPPEYLWFDGDGIHNWFRYEYSGSEFWDWSFPDVYAEDGEL